jgi:hypothetical protein
LWREDDGSGLPLITTHRATWRLSRACCQKWRIPRVNADQRITNETPLPNANTRRRLSTEMTVFIDFSGAVSALITAWLEVRVLPGPPRIRTQPEISRLAACRPDLAGIRACVSSLLKRTWSLRSFREPLSLPAKSRFPETETGFAETQFESRINRLKRPSIWCCFDHSAGKSARRATPMPRGSRPSIAALTRSGARNANEIVMLTFRVLHPSRVAILSVVAVTSVVSSSSPLGMPVQTSNILRRRKPKGLQSHDHAKKSGKISFSRDSAHE